MISEGNSTHIFSRYQFLDFDIVLSLDGISGKNWVMSTYDLSVIYSQLPVTLK